MTYFMYTSLFFHHSILIHVVFTRQVTVPLGQITTPSLLKEKILSVRQTNGQTFTGQGLKVMQKMFQSHARNGKCYKIEAFD